MRYIICSNNLWRRKLVIKNWTKQQQKSGGFQQLSGFDFPIFPLSVYIVNFYA